MLARFWGVHAAWEPALATRPELSGVLAGRSRLPHLAADLAALGAGREEIADLPVCAAAAALADTPERAWGSLYVMEGSTLGGKVIARSLAAADWLPPEGLGYFDAHGAETGRRWRALAAAMEDAVPRSAWPRVAEGATLTFQVVRAWVASEAR